MRNEKIDSGGAGTPWTAPAGKPRGPGSPGLTEAGTGLQPGRAPGGWTLARGLTRMLGGCEDLVFVIDDAGRFAAASSPLIDLLQTTEADLLGQPVARILADAAETIDGGSAGRVSFRGAGGAVFSALLAVLLVPLGQGRMLRMGMLSQLGTTGDAEPEEAPAGGDSADAPAPGPLPPAGDGRIRVISLDPIKAMLGPRWTSQAERVKTIARSLIDKRLAAADMFAEAENDGFVICFASLSAGEARLKADLISREIHERLIGDAAPAVSIEAPPVPPTAARPAPASDATMLTALTGRLDSARARRLLSAEQRVDEALSRASLLLTPILTRTLEPSPLSLARIGGDDLGWLHGLSGDTDEGRVAAELDALLLGMVIKHVYENAADSATPAIVVPVTYTTLHHRRLVGDYIAVCHRIDRSIRSRILFEVHGVGADVPRVRLHEILSRLAPFSGRQVLRVPDLSQRFADAGRLRLGMLSIMADAAHPADGRGASVESFAAMVRNPRGGTGGGSGGSGCRILVRDVRDQASARWYLSKGVDFVSVLDADADAPTSDRGLAGR